MKPTQEQVLQWARKAGFVGQAIYHDVDGFLRFATLAYEAGRKDENEALKNDGWRQCAVGQRTTQFCGQLEQAVAAERELCAKVCEDYRDDWLRGEGRYEFMGEGADYCAEAIRARGEQ